MHTQTDFDWDSASVEDATFDHVRLSRHRVGIVARPAIQPRIALNGSFRIDPVDELEADVESDPKRLPLSLATLLQLTQFDQKHRLVELAP